MAITESRILPPEFIEAAQKTYLTDLTRQAGIPSITTAVQQQPGETAQQFAQRQAQAQQFGITKAGMAELAPQVAAQDPLQAAAYAQAVDPTKGLGAGTGVGSISSYMSPYQSQVIDTTLSEFDKQRQIQANQQAAAALGTPGAFGGGREGVMRAEYQSASDLNRAKILADLQQRGFQQAQQSRQQDLANQMGISELQTGLGARAQDFSRAQISGLGTLGAAQQAQNQAVLDAQRQASAMAVQDPRDRLARFGQGITGLTPGAGTVQVDPQAATAPGASPLAQALGIGLAGADIYGRIFK
jgi:Arc/MetJ-type ribon-helix-helix transcriptional regulator